MTHQSTPRLCSSDLDGLLTALEVSFVTIAECLVSPGWRLQFSGIDAPGIHYNLGGEGRMFVGSHAPIDLLPHSLIIVPPRAPLRIEVSQEHQPSAELLTLHGSSLKFQPGAPKQFVAGGDAPQVILICGYFNASFGASTNLFSALDAPIVEQFEPDDQLDVRLKMALGELVAQQVGMVAMTTTLLKQVLVTLLRRSFLSSNSWDERFSMLRDPKIARAFAEMVTRPGAPHSVEGLAKSAGLSRSAFMARFSELFGRSPMVVLRDLRMRNAATMLAGNTFTISQVAEHVGYSSRSSFIRAFQKTYGIDPSRYRAGWDKSSNEAA